MSDSENSVYRCVDCADEFEEQEVLQDHLRTVHQWTDENIAAGEKEYEVEGIIDHEWCNDRKDHKYTVRWVGYDEPSPIYRDNFDEGCVLLKSYDAKHGLVPGKKSKGEQSERVGTRKRKSAGRSVSRSRTASVIPKDESSGSMSRNESPVSGHSPPPKTRRKKATPLRDKENVSADEDSDAEDADEEPKRQAYKAEKESDVIVDLSEVEPLDAHYIVEDDYLNGRKANKIVGMSYLPEDPTELMYLVQFKKIADETKQQATRFVPANIAWERYTKQLRTFYEKKVVTMVQEVTASP